jgi:biotin carboxyl carrier protein
MKTFKFMIRGNEYEVDIISLENGIARIEVNGTKYNVELEKTPQHSKTPVLVRRPVVVPPGASKIKKQENGTYKVKAPLPGNVVQVFVKEGDSVKKDDKLLVYEAMKMENTVQSEKEGKITKINVKAGDAVLQDDVLMEIELG